MVHRGKSFNFFSKYFLKRVKESPRNVNQHQKSTLVSRIAAYMLLFFFGKFCTPICLIQAYAFIDFQKNCKNIVLKIRFYTNPYASIQNFSTLCLYDFFEIASSMLLFPTMPQYETLEYILSTFFSVLTSLFKMPPGIHTCGFFNTKKVPTC